MMDIWAPLFSNNYLIRFVSVFLVAGLTAGFCVSIVLFPFWYFGMESDLYLPAIIGTAVGTGLLNACIALSYGKC